MERMDRIKSEQAEACYLFSALAMNPSTLKPQRYDRIQLDTDPEYSILMCIIGCFQDWFRDFLVSVVLCRVGTIHSL